MSEKEIKFRAWDEENKRMLYSNEHQTVWVGGAVCSVNSDSGQICTIPYKHVMQFIVKEDGQDIYEDDVIEETVHGKTKRRFVAEDIRTFTREYDKSHHAAIWKVIGNATENPQLLGKQDAGNSDTI